MDLLSSMKSGFFFMFFVIGMLICATYAAPTSSQIQEENNKNKVKELLDLIDQAVKSQHDDDDLAESESMNVKEALEVLKHIAKLQEDSDDHDDDLTEKDSLDNNGEMAEEQNDEDEDDAKVQILPFNWPYYFRRRSRTLRRRPPTRPRSPTPRPPSRRSRPPSPYRRPYFPQLPPSPHSSTSPGSFH